VAARHRVEVVERPVERIEHRPFEIAVRGVVVGAMARGNDQPALWIVDAATGTGDPYSFAQMSERSSRIANWLRAIGVVRGD
ncbi:hypothetical protein QM306_39145, partial [Burkholderia cenocepacia]|nr:hypothetical protein [Burkholderia cenocepacia]